LHPGNGEIPGIEGDVAAMPDPDIGYKRIDSFDFRLGKIEGDIACAVYFLKSEITDRVKGIRNKEWLGSAVLHRPDEGWMMPCCALPKLQSRKSNLFDIWQRGK